MRAPPAAWALAGTVFKHQAELLQQAQAQLTPHTPPKPDTSNLPSSFGQFVELKREVASLKEQLDATNARLAQAIEAATVESINENCKSLQMYSHIEGDTLELSKKMGGHMPTACRAVGEMSAGLTKLNLSQHKINDAGAIALAEGLKSNASLKELVLGNCGITREGKRALQKAIKGRKRFKLVL